VRDIRIDRSGWTLLKISVPALLRIARHARYCDKACVLGIFAVKDEVFTAKMLM
jgi:hypothetical protein